MTQIKINTPVVNDFEKTAAAESVRHRSRYERELAAIEHLPRRHWLLHALAIVQSAVSLGILIYGMAAFQGPVPAFLAWLDIGLAVLFLFEFFTRSGFRWNPRKYAASHLFDFFALVPALLFLHRGVPAEGLWIWIILLTRGLRLSDRILGDGFLLYNFIVLLDGLLEELTDRVVLRLMDRLQADLIEGRFGNSTADAMIQNKTAVLRRVREEHPRDSISADLARFVGLEAAVEQAESRIYDAMVDVVRSPEVDKIINENLNSIFAELRAETGKRDWIKKFGLPQHHRRTPKTAAKAESD